eukprot:1705734-Heterocapsa_arctica.AAC.1
MNRLQSEQAAILGVLYAYASEVLSGLARPCPPGPGLHLRWEECFPFPLVFIPVPNGFYGKEQEALYRSRELRASAKTPANSWSHEI